MKKNYKKLQREAFSAEFTKFCRKNIQEPMKELEKKRMNYILGICLISMIGVIAEGFVGYNMFINEQITQHSITPLIIIPFVIFGLCMMVVKTYKNKAKEIRDFLIRLADPVS